MPSRNNKTGSSSSADENVAQHTAAAIDLRFSPSSDWNALSLFGKRVFIWIRLNRSKIEKREAGSRTRTGTLALAHTHTHTHSHAAATHWRTRALARL